jgi:hypothetical protein
VIELKLPLADSPEKGAVNGLNDVFSIEPLANGRCQVPMRLRRQLVYKSPEDYRGSRIVAGPHAGQ